MYSSRMSFSTLSFYLSFALELSRLESIELNVPVANENAMTSITMRVMQIIFSEIDPPEMSPYPTMVMVVIVKYKEITYSCKC